MKRLLPPLLCAALALTACTQANDQSAGQTSSSSSTTSESVVAACADVADKAGVLLAAIGRLATGNATTGEVGTAAGELSAVFDDALTAVGPDARADLEDAGEALGRIVNVLSTQPIDTAALRTAANELLTELGEAADVCTPDSTTVSTTSTEESRSSEESTTSSPPTVTTTS
jgi:hypothetical protein